MSRTSLSKHITKKLRNTKGTRYLLLISILTFNLSLTSLSDLVAHDVSLTCCSYNRGNLAISYLLSQLLHQSHLVKLGLGGAVLERLPPSLSPLRLFILQSGQISKFRGGDMR